ncbi:acylphosphatase-2-like [Musca autumnalis]|uniref:acylphosphatase-2-like n=1 Tax=Musca autumnalis TaxID=221902 RepID=UPI003CE99FE8
MGSRQLYNCDFEVFGKVQGVFFRKHAQKKAKLLGIHGWIMNTPEGTVKGQMEGTQMELNEMKSWLTTKGSPKSEIEKAFFGEMKPMDMYTFKSFVINK